MRLIVLTGQLLLGVVFTPLFMPKKIQRAVLDIPLDISDINGGDSGYVDIAECLSMMNRRKYEQGRLYHLSGVTQLLSRPDDAASQASFYQCSYYTAPNTWVTANAWYKAKKTWDQMNDQVLDNNPSLKSKWMDFKVHLNESHKTAAQANNLTPAGVSEGEWNMATMTLPDWDVADNAKHFEIGLCGNNAGTVAGGDLTYGGIIHNYQESRARVPDFSPDEEDPADSWGIRLLDLGGQESELSDILTSENDQPPYDADDYPGVTGNLSLATFGSWAQSTNTYNLESHMVGGYLPCGLLRILVSPYADTDLSAALVLHVTPGTYKGVHAPTMRQ